MRIPRLYVPIALSENSDFVLPTEQSHYIGKVLRMTVNSQLVLFNGEGGEYEASITNVQKKSVSVHTSQFLNINNESSLSIHLGIGISKGDRMDYAIQKSTELGVHDITPIFASRSEVKLTGERLQKKLAHWQQIAISASEQSKRQRPPTVNPPLNLCDWLANNESDLNFVLHHRTDDALASIEQTPESISLLIGPEGGLSKEEISSAEERNFNALSLGPRVMRTETAPIAAISILQYRWGDI